MWTRTVPKTPRAGERFSGPGFPAAETVMSVAEINAIKDAIIEIIGAIVLLGFCVFFCLACIGMFDKK